jgi:hypothetical protein
MTDQLKMDPIMRRKMTPLPAALECSKAKRIPEVANMIWL